MVGALWPVEVGLLLIPTGMFSVLSGTIDDSYGGMLDGSGQRAHSPPAPWYLLPRRYASANMLP